jgi:hypothetical protein
MVEIPRPQAKRGFVMPAQAGIHLRFRWQAKENLDSCPDQVRGRLCAGMTKRRVDFESTNSEPPGLEPKVIQFREMQPGTVPGRLALAYTLRPVESKSFRSGAEVNRAEGVNSLPVAPSMRFDDMQYLASAGSR